MILCKNSKQTVQKKSYDFFLDLGYKSPKPNFSSFFNNSTLFAFKNVSEKIHQKPTIWLQLYEAYILKLEPTDHEPLVAFKVQ